MYGRSSELGLYQTYTSTHPFDTLIAGLDKAALKDHLAIMVRGHEDSRATFLCRALASEPVDLPIVVNLQCCS